MIISFRLNCSTNNALFSIIKNIQTQLDNWESVAGVFVDLKKAFDIVVIVIYSLENLITMMSKGSQRSGYLIYRKQFVVIENEISSVETVSIDVPHGLF